MLITTAVVVVVVGGGAVAWAATRSPDAPAYRSVAVTTATLRQTLSSSGTIQPAQQANLSFAVSGQVTAVDVAVGDQVTAGQALATVDSAALAATVAEARATAASAQARLSSDESGGASSAQVAADQAAVTAAQNQLDNAQSALSEATLSTPIAGTVAAVDLTVGQSVSGGGASSGSGGAAGSGSAGSGSSGGGATAGDAQIVVVATDAYVVDAAVDDTEVGQVRTGDQAVITPDGATTPVYGTVTAVAMLPSGSSSVPSYPVTIGVTGHPAGLHPGAGATVSIVVRQLTNVLVVPTAAVHYSGGRAVVYQLSGGRQVSRPVTLGITVGGRTQVVGGLSAGDQVLVPDTGGATRAGTRAGTRTGGTGGRFGGGLGGAGLDGGTGRP